jgi:nucleoside-diphosphate-sugar epimerase
MKILDLGQKMLDLAGISAGIELHASPAGSVPRRSHDISKLRKLINFKEEWTLDLGFEETMKFYLK